MKLLRSKATKGQLETAGQYVAQLRRVQGELWPLLQPVLQDLYGERGGAEARLGEGGPAVDLLGGALVSGLASDVVLWSVQQNDLLSWTSLWLTFRPFCSANDVVATLCDVAEFGADSLPPYACHAAKHHATASLGVRRNAVKLILLGQLMQAVAEQDLQERLTMRMYRLIGQLSVADQGTGDAQLAGLARGWQVKAPPPGCVERFVERWQRAIDEAAPPSALNTKFDVLKTEPGRMAEHLTRTDCALFWHVTLADFQRFCGLAPDKGKADGSVFRLIEKRFDRMVWVVLSMICWSDNTTELLAYWIAVLEELEKLGNWHSLMMLSSVLNHYLVEFMKKSWAALPPEALRAVQRVAALFFPGNNYREYRNRYKVCVLPCFSLWFLILSRPRSACCGGPTRICLRAERGRKRASLAWQCLSCSATSSSAPKCPFSSSTSGRPAPSTASACACWGKRRPCFGSRALPRDTFSDL